MGQIHKSHALPFPEDAVDQWKDSLTGEIRTGVAPDVAAKASRAIIDILKQQQG